MDLSNFYDVSPEFHLEGEFSRKSERSRYVRVLLGLLTHVPRPVSRGLALLVLVSACANSGQSVSQSSHPVPAQDRVPATDPANVEGGEPTTTVDTDSGPITGYGNWSDSDYYSVDWRLAFNQVAECLQDQGFPVEFDEDTGGIMFGLVPTEQNIEAQRTEERCVRGLELPEFRWPDEGELRVIFEYQLALAECLRLMGVDTSEPPTFDLWTETYQSGPWMAYEAVGQAQMDLRQLERQCPQTPVGGFGAWKPGQPVQPLHTAP